MIRTLNGLPVRGAHAGAALVPLLAVALAACGNLTAGGLAEATVVLSGDAPEESPQASGQTAVLPAASAPRAQGSGTSAASEPEGGSPAAASDGGGPEGEVEVVLSLFLVAEDGDLVPITEGDVRVRVDLEGAEEPEIARRSITPQAYTGLRMVFTEIEAEVDAGLIIDGEIVSGEIDVEIEDPLTVTKPFSLGIVEGERVELLVDLNAEDWLLAVNPATKLVDAQVFADLVSVRVR